METTKGDRESELEICEGPIYTFVKKLPKVELHAHLNGSLSQKTLQKLVDLRNERKSSTEATFKMPCITSNDMSECFQVFSLIHKITDNPEAIYMATCDVIEEFYSDGVHYLELRTTPKEMGPGLTQDIYVETVLKAIRETCSHTCPEMSVKLLLSIDRKRSMKAAEDMLKIAEKHFASSSEVVGIDLSGDPTTGDVNLFLPVLNYAKRVGLKLAVHIAEVSNTSEENELLLKLHPDRLGHGTYLHPLKGGSTWNFNLLKKLKIPLEICLTSNYISKTVPSYEEHHFPLFRELDYPCIICTDDKGIFNTTLSKEYCIASSHYSLSREDLFNMSYNNINYTFADEGLKTKLKTVWKKSNQGQETELISDD